MGRESTLQRQQQGPFGLVGGAGNDALIGARAPISAAVVVIFDYNKGSVNPLIPVVDRLL
jgi:hypothetical protein